MSGLPLRTTLVALLMALVAGALVVSGFVAVAALRGYLYREVDQALTEVATRLADGPAMPAPDDEFRPVRPGPVGEEFTYIRMSDATGTEHEVSDDSLQVTDPPALADLPVADARALEGVAFVVDSASGESRWRVVAIPRPDGSGTVTAAQDISGIDATVARLVVIEVAIGALVVLLVGAAGWVLVRRSLRPLVDVEHAAAAIAGGDLTRRAPGADPRTEVGSLSASFNTMVDALQGAFAAQRASEQSALDSAVAARASEARMRQFIADASHELRTPLTSVRGFAELHRIGAVPEGAPLEDAMARIESEAARMGILVDDLLLLARLDQQRPLERRPVDLVGLVADAVAAAGAAAPERAIRVDVAADAAALTVPGDSTRLRQVVDNLVSNAVRYSPPDSEVEVRVGLSRDDGQPDWGTLEVVDHGPGMTPEVAARVFERFYRADRARSRQHGGSGLGLAIVAAIVAAHGGRVEVDSAPGQGSTFRVLLPVDTRVGRPSTPTLQRATMEA
jgi:two-component system OmpR family sensor kinase